jgi:predicted dehydrogenase
MAYAGTPLERERFPETFLFIEGDRGSLELGPDCQLRLTTLRGGVRETRLWRAAPPRHAWADPAYDVVHASIVPCNEDFLRALRGERPAEATGADNLETVRLVFGCYEAAEKNAVVALEAGRG